MLGSLWQPGQYTVLIQGLSWPSRPTTAWPATAWSMSAVGALLRAAVRHQVDRQPYDYIEVSKGSPETL